MLQKRHLTIIVIFSLLLGVGIGLFASSKALSQHTLFSSSAPSAASKDKAVEEVKRATVLATGDVVMHPPLYVNNKDANGNYRYDSFFAKVQDQIQGADLALINFEGPYDLTRPPNGYPVFNNPPGLLDYLKGVGFDAVATANNHCLDAGFDGMERTLQEMDKVGLGHFGTHLQGKNGRLIKEVNGIKIGLCGWTEAYNGLEVLVPEERRDQISPLTAERAAADIRALKEEGADIVVCWPHWGNEYTTQPNEYEINMAKELVRAGADIILGSHVHVLQPAQWIEVDGRRAYAVFSMGNAISNQREMYLGTMDTEIGVFVNLTIEKKGNEPAKLVEEKLVPTYVNLFRDARGLAQYEVRDLSEAVNDESATPALRDRYAKAKTRAEEILNAPIPAFQGQESKAA